MQRVMRTALMALSMCSLATLAQAETKWTRFRGPEGTGVSQETDLPVKWDDSNVKWRTPLPGAGQSSPVIWMDKILLTSAVPTDQGVERWVICVNRADGKILWQQLAETTQGEPLHSMNTWASATCATDGECVIAFFGLGGMHAYSLDGEKLWSRDLGKFAGPWGTAASPVIVGDVVIQNCDADEDAYIIGLDKKSGKTVWQTKRDNIRGWSTPVLIKAGDREELVLNGDHGVQSYNPQTGEEYWFCKSFTGRGSPLPAVGHGMLFVINGKPGPIYAIRPGGSGDVTGSHMAWNTPRRVGRDLPSPILIGNSLFVTSMNGVSISYDPMTGKEVWKGRLEGNFSAAPMAADGYIYTNNEAGRTYVVKPSGDDVEIVAKNDITPGDGDELFRSSIVPCEGQLFLRSHNALYCIAK